MLPWPPLSPRKWLHFSMVWSNLFKECANPNPENGRCNQQKSKDTVVEQYINVYIYRSLTPTKCVHVFSGKPYVVSHLCQFTQGCFFAKSDTLPSKVRFHPRDLLTSPGIVDNPQIPMENPNGQFH